MSPIGVFDSGYGGLTILQQLRRQLPEHDFLYLGDNARAPYGSRSFDVVYEFTRQAVMKLFSMGCRLVILGCNTASAKALRTIQQRDLLETCNILPHDLTTSHPHNLTALQPHNPTTPQPHNPTALQPHDPATSRPQNLITPPPHNLMEQGYRVLGVIRPTVEVIGSLTSSRHVGVVATEGTVRSESYTLEIAKFFPDIKVTGQACPLWAAIVEAGESESEGAEYFVRKRISQLLEKDPLIDTIILGCTHYPLLINAIKKATPQGIRIVSQGEYVASSLEDYLRRHPDMNDACSKGGTVRFFTTESPERFKECAAVFLHEDVCVEHIDL